MMVSEQVHFPLAMEEQPTSADGTSSEALAVLGDSDSFIRLYETHVQAVYNYLLGRLRHRQDAEDVTALVFGEVWRSLPRYRPTGSFKGWLFTIAHRILLRQIRVRPKPTLPIEPLADVLVDPALGPEESALATDSVRQTIALLTTLRPEQQEVITLRFLADLPYKDIARVVGKRESAVKLITYRALVDLRRRTQDVQPE
jgi:RNA polymerase sigma-70 factor (ECF subfamily)